MLRELESAAAAIIHRRKIDRSTCHIYSWFKTEWHESRNSFEFQGKTYCGGTLYEFIIIMLNSIISPPKPAILLRYGWDPAGLQTRVCLQVLSTASIRADRGRTHISVPPVNDIKVHGNRGVSGGGVLND